MAKIDLIVKATDQATGTLNGIVGSFTEFKSALDLTKGSIRAVVDAAKQIYEFGKAGATLEYASVKFDRLAKSIGRTSNSLMTDLRKATRGTLSDAELMASAGDIMSLGLVKTADQVVRLSKVTSGLGMDMNQLVLTLSNQTTMRFDQLGVSVAGFDDKVKKLRQSGLDANAAFTEAFLQQAEQQLEKVGNKADENIGSFQRFEAEIKNVDKAVHSAANGPISDMVGFMADLIRSSREVHAELGHSIDASNAYASALELQLIALVGKTDAEKKSRQQFLDNRIAAEKYTEALKQSSKGVIDNSDAEKLANTEARQFNSALSDQSAHARNVSSSFGALIDAQNKLTDAQKNWKAGVGNDIASKLEAAGLKGQALYDALKLVDQVQGTNSETAARQKDAIDKLVASYDPKNPEAFKKGMEELDKTFEPLDESIKESQILVENLQQKVLELTGQAYWVLIHTRVDGDLGNVGNGNTGTPKTPLNPNDPNSRRDWGLAYGGPAMAGVPHIVGERGPEIFVPHQSGTVVPNNITNNFTFNAPTSRMSAVHGYQVMKALAGV